MDKLDLHDRIIVAAGALLLVDSFLPWFEVDTIFGSFSANGWDYPLVILAVLVGLAMAIQVVLANLTEVELPEKVGNLSWGKVHMFGGIAAGALVLLQLLMGDSPADRAFGAFLGMAFAGALTYAGLVKGRESNRTEAA